MFGTYCKNEEPVIIDGIMGFGQMEVKFINLYI